MTRRRNSCANAERIIDFFYIPVQVRSLCENGKESIEESRKTGQRDVFITHNSNFDFSLYILERSIASPLPQPKSAVENT